MQDALIFFICGVLGGVIGATLSEVSYFLWRRYRDSQTVYSTDWPGKEG